jgi:NADH-quinone oxidoreductase subunit L
LPTGADWTDLNYPSEHDHHCTRKSPGRTTAEMVAFLTALAGFLLATIVYGWRISGPNEVAQQFRPLYLFLLHKWYFDELYQAIFVEPGDVRLAPRGASSTRR